MTDQSALQIATGVATQGYLKALALYRLGGVHIDGVRRILELCLQLVDLRLAATTPSGGLFSDFAKTRPHRCLRLRWLTYWGRTDVLSDFLSNLCLPFLERLDLKVCKGAPLVASKRAGFRLFPKLSHLSISGDFKLGVVSAQALRKCVKLRILQLDSDLKEDVVSALVDGLSSRLVELQIGRVPEQCTDLIARRFIRLRRLWMKNAEAVGVRRRINAISNALVAPLQTTNFFQSFQ